MRPVLAIALLTWKAALRFRLFLVLAGLLLLSVVGLPMLVKDDGTARGFTQILLTYTLGTITALLGLSTLWLSCGTLARDIEECQLQMVVVKPVARWQIWLGKWLGVVSLDAVLLALAGACVFGLLQWRASKLPPALQAALRYEVLVARGSARERSFARDIELRSEELFKQWRTKHMDASKPDIDEVRKAIREQVKAGLQVVLPGYSSRPWEINLPRPQLSPWPADLPPPQVQRGERRAERHLSRLLPHRRAEKDQALPEPDGEHGARRISRIRAPARPLRRERPADDHLR